MKAGKKEDEYERDSLDSDDDNCHVLKDKLSKGKKQDQLKMLNDAKGESMGNVDWLEQSIKQSVCQWKATLAYH